MFGFNREVPLPEQWQDERIQSVAALLSLAANVLVEGGSAQQSEERLQQVAAQYSLDPDQIYRAMYEHEDFLAFQEKDHALAKVAFKEFF